MSDISLLGALQAHPELLISLTGIIGLIIGSFLNVVIYRLPIMMERTWKKECQEFLELEPEKEHKDTFNLILPHSCCPNCKSPIRAYQNIPIISYIFLKGKCANCKTPISIRYPAIELLTGITSATIAWHFGYSSETLFALFLTWALITLSSIDIDCQLLPDSITLPMLWAGLFLSLFSICTDSHSSSIGAIAGYLSFWFVFHVFKLVTGKEGIGYGDFKLLALFGAWLGWEYLPIIIIFSSLVGAVVGISMVILVKRDHRLPIPFGPYLAAAGWFALLWGDDINRVYLNSIGL